MRLTSRHTLAFLAGVALAALAAPAAAVDPGSELITCDRADERVEITVSSHLDPSCTWTRGVEILASNVTLDCQDAPHRGPGPSLRCLHPRAHRHAAHQHHRAQLPRRGLPQQLPHRARGVPRSRRGRRVRERLLEHHDRGQHEHELARRRHLRQRLRRGRDAAQPPRRGRQQHGHLPRGRLEEQRRREQHHRQQRLRRERSRGGRPSRSRASTSGSGAPDARAWRSTARASTSSATTRSRATSPAASSSTRTAASS